MNKDEVLEKYGNPEYQVDSDTYVMGVHHLLSKHIAERFRGSKKVLDACVGAGFMSIAIAKVVDRVIAFDIDESHLDQAQANAGIADVREKIEFIHKDILEALSLDEIKNIDAAFLDPDWSVREGTKNVHIYTEFSDLQPNGSILLEEVNKLTKNICLRLPKEFDISKLDTLPAHETQAVYQGDKLKFYCVYFGDLRANEGITELRV